MAVAERIRAAKPRTVILPYWDGRHPDHYTAAILGYEACYAAGLKQLPIAGEPHRPKKILYSAMYADVRPSFSVDISEFFPKKLEAINCFASQFSGDMKDIAGTLSGLGTPARSDHDAVQVLRSLDRRRLRRAFRREGKHGHRRRGQHAGGVHLTHGGIRKPCRPTDDGGHKPRVRTCWRVRAFPGST